MLNVLFLAYANSQDNPLPSLSREDDGIFSILINRALKGHFLIHRDSFTTREKLIHYLDLYQDRLSLFLFSGHAGEEMLWFGKEKANSKGIAYQLKQSAQKGKLKIVILNGCSTAGQVRELLAAGVPVVVATTAPVNDESATEFSLRFFKGLSEKRQSIRQAFDEALGPAITVTKGQLDNENIPRGLALREDIEDKEPLWGLFCSDPDLLEQNPLPSRNYLTSAIDYEPNEKLTSVLFATLLKADCRDISALYEKEQAGDYVEVGDKQTTIVNVLPFPIAIHLQKLLCPVEQENEGFDDISLRRLEQIGKLYQVSIELLTFVMLSQLWEFRLIGKVQVFPKELLEQIRQFFSLNHDERAIFNGISFIQAIGDFFETLRDAEEHVYFIEELDHLISMSEAETPFANTGTFTYRDIKRPDSLRDQLEVPKEGPFEVVYIQLEAFRKMILAGD